MFEKRIQENKKAFNERQVAEYNLLHNIKMDQEEDLFGAGSEPANDENMAEAKSEDNEEVIDDLF